MKIGFDNVLKVILIFMAMNVLAVTPQDVLERDFFSSEPHCYLTPESRVREKPKGKLGNENKLKYKNSYSCKTTGNDKYNRRKWNQNEKIVVSYMQKKYGGYIYPYRASCNYTTKTSLTTPNEKQKENKFDEYVNCYQEGVVYDNVISTNFNERQTTTFTRQVKTSGFKPLRYYTDESDFSDDEDLYYSLYETVHTAVTNISGNTATIVGQYKETGYSRYVDDLSFGTDIELIKNYKTTIKVSGDSLSINQEIEETRRAYFAQKKKTTAYYSAEFYSGNAVKSEQETVIVEIKRQTTPEFIERLKDYYGGY